MTTETENTRRILWCSGILTLLVFFIAPCDGMTTVRMIMSETESLNYLSRHGYLSPLNSTDGRVLPKEMLSKAISEFQSDVGIPITGELDAATIQHMSISRCGVSDKRKAARNAQKEEYHLQGSKWPRTDLTYKILNYPRGLQPEAVDREISKAFNMWAEHTFLVFTPSYGKADINISFDESSSDGPGNALGNGYFPETGGSIHFDANEYWTIDSYNGTTVLQAATHLIGHALGMKHSNVKSAVMWPFAKEYDPSFRLDIDDVRAIQHLYGVKSGGKSEGPDFLKNDDNDLIRKETLDFGLNLESFLVDIVSRV